MNQYIIKFQFLNGPVQTVNKFGKNERRALQALYEQLGASSRLNIHEVRKI